MPRLTKNEDALPHEHEFTADVVSWMSLIIEKDASLPFSSVKFDRRTKGIQKRRDLSLIGKDEKILVTGEIKLPYQKDGATPYNASVVSDARQKAAHAGADYFFTWNVNECVLWKTDAPTENLVAGQYYRSWKVVSVAKESHLVLSSTEEAIKNWLGLFLNELAKIIRGNARVGFKSPDEHFVETLESALSLPIRLTFEELEQRYRSVRSKNDLDRWMRDEQGWTLAADDEGIRDLLERAAKFSCYALVNRLVFYEALMKRYGALLHKLNIPSHIDKGDDLRLHLEGFFRDAREITGDYETVFGENHSNIGNRIPLYSDHAVDYWRSLINQIHEFDFSKLDYEIIGSIFERLISPDERHKYGQYYTRVEVVDLINSFCIRTGKEAVMDPACGGGTFLVRAYVRKRELAPQRPHEKILAELYGVDISPFASHLTTINLATRDLVQDENYPLIARSDFFDVSTKNRFMSLPSKTQSKGLGKIQYRDIEIPMLDAVIGNPPYVRQEDIKSYKPKKKEAARRGTKEFYRALVKKERQANLSGRSDLHCYFWPHASAFLKPEGWLCLLTSSQWLDVEYGFKLQDWILSHFKIIAIFESTDEPWFVGARVVTAVTILQACESQGERDHNVVRFVQLRQPIADLLIHDGTTAGAMAVADSFRDEILGLNENTFNTRYRTRLVPQKELLEDGIQLGRLMRSADDGGEAEGDDEDKEGDNLRAATDAYYGGKWGILLRAPDLWFEFTDRFGDQWKPLGELAEVRFGVKSGKDEFFLPRDASKECLDKFPAFHEFQREFGIKREDVESGSIKLVYCGEKLGEIRPIESEYLEPEIHSLMEVDGYMVEPKDCSRMILLVSQPKSKLRGTHVLKYIEWGESKRWNKAATCAARAGEKSFWYDLSKQRRPYLILPKIQQYRLQSFINPKNLYQNSSLLGIYTANEDEALKIGAILNCSFAVLSRILFARILGNEGTIQLDVYSAKMMLIPFVANGALAQGKAIEAFRNMMQRPALQFLSERRMRRMSFTKAGQEAELEDLSDRSELDMEDRRALDNAVLEMLGVKNQREREDLIDRLYSYLKEFFESVRQKEEKAIINKNKSKRRDALSPVEIAAQVLAEIKNSHGNLLRSYGDFVDINRPYSTFDLPVMGEAEVHEDIFAPEGSVRFMRGRKQLAMLPMKIREQAPLVAFIAKHDVRGLVRIPLKPEDCVSLKNRYETFIEDRTQQFNNIIANRTGDPDLQEEIFDALNDLIHHETGF